MNRICLLIVAGLGLGAVNTGCMHALGRQQPISQNHRDPDVAPQPAPRSANPPKYVLRGDQIFELLVTPAGGTHVKLPPETIVVKGHNYVPRAFVFQPQPEVQAAPLNTTPSNVLPFPNKMPEKAKTSAPPTSFGKSDPMPRQSTTALPDDEEVPQAVITGVRAMTPEEVLAYEKEKAKEKAAKDAAATKPPAATLGQPFVEEERQTPGTLPKEVGPILGAPVAPLNPVVPTVPTPTITPPPPAALPRQDWTPVPPARDLPPEDTRPKNGRKDLETSNRK